MIQIAAIDNGLAFPFKHPDEWRACKCLYSLSHTHTLPYVLELCVCVRPLPLGVASSGQSGVLSGDEGAGSVPDL